jgi:hypothetical protein
VITPALSNLAVVTAASTPGPNVASPAAPPGNSSATQDHKLTSIIFTALMGSLLEKDNASDQASKKKQADDDPIQAQNLTVPASATPPIVMPAVLRLHFCLPLTTASKLAKTEPEQNQTEAGGTSVIPAPAITPQANPQQVAPQASSELQAAPPPAAAPQTFVGASFTTSMAAPMLEAPSPRVSAASDDARSFPRPELAFAARLTGGQSAVSQPQLMPPPPQPTQATPLKSTTTTATPLPPIVSSNPGPSQKQQADSQQDQQPQAGTEDNGSSPQAAKPAQKPGVRDQQTQFQPDREHSAGASQEVAPQIQLRTLASPSSIGPQSQTISSQTPGAPEPANAEKAHDPQPAASATVLPHADWAAKSEPVRDLSLLVGSSSTGQVEVKVQERAGEIRVAVHSSNPELTTELRQQLGDLVGKLERSGYHTETYKPSLTPASPQSSNPSGTGQQQDLPGRQQQQQQQGGGRQKKVNQPQWVQEMNTTFGPTPVEGILNK